MVIRNNNNFTGRPAYQNLALPSVQQVLLEKSGGRALSAKKAEDVNSKLNQMDALNLLHMSQNLYAPLTLGQARSNPKLQSISVQKILQADFNKYEFLALLSVSDLGKLAIGIKGMQDLVKIKQQMQSILVQKTLQSDLNKYQFLALLSVSDLGKLAIGIKGMQDLVKIKIRQRMDSFTPIY